MDFLQRNTSQGSGLDYRTASWLLLLEQKTLQENQ
jgi:hypothetical protein